MDHPYDIDMEQEKLASPIVPHFPEVPRDRTVFGDVLSALDILGGAVRRLENHPLASNDLPEKLQNVDNAAALKEELGGLCARFQVCEGRVSEVAEKLEAVDSEVTDELRSLGGSLGGILERQDVVSMRVEGMERVYRELKESIRSMREDFLALGNDIGSLTSRIEIYEENVMKLGDGLKLVHSVMGQERDRLSTTRSKVDEITEAQNEVVLRVAGLERGHRNIDEVVQSVKSGSFFTNVTERVNTLERQNTELTEAVETLVVISEEAAARKAKGLRGTRFRGWTKTRDDLNPISHNGDGQGGNPGVTIGNSDIAQWKDWLDEKIENIPRSRAEISELSQALDRQLQKRLGLSDFVSELCTQFAGFIISVLLLLFCLKYFIMPVNGTGALIGVFVIGVFMGLSPGKWNADGARARAGGRV
ncbi:hypothetical protein L873DRAFT_194914 [Choiromyces venosus 120613-1]|uniref:Uncharacterized protein n=1 Tax=Choiromyces venosus 120613-1 TaxID=1336337 RepID=A0A3N4J262_9PEZI|nr:hypothetical protein L873DRAFT_194914 [Choiromyces venosus 120613-1]